MMRTLSAFAPILALVFASPLAATWSIIAADTDTQEVAVASATCVTNLDLRAVSPALRVGVGGGAAQSQIDSSGTRRSIMWDGLIAGDTSDVIMQRLIALSGSSSHQNGLADTGGDSASFSGSSTGAHSSGVTGQIGTLHYAIQGNLLTGRPVITAAEAALRDSANGDLPGRVMAAMEAARAMGGDGRCSCSPAAPTSCGSPPASFTKSAHVGFLIVSRFGDTNDGACTSNGCADGDYFLNLNFPFQGSSDPDPVLQMRQQFDSFRQGLIGRPDAVRSTVTIVPQGDDFVLTVTPVDWQGTALPPGVVSVSVEHAPGSAQATSIGPVTALGDGRFQTILTTVSSGLDRFLVTLRDGIRDVVIPPRRTTLDVAGTPPPPCEVLVYSAGFESGSDGWVDGASTCTTGTFVQGTPDGVNDGGVQTQVAGASVGSGAWFTQPNTGGAGTDDVDGGTCETLSPPIAVGAGSTVTAFADYFHGQRDAGDDSADGFSIELIDADTGAVLGTLVSFGDVTNQAAWTPAFASVGGAPANVRLRVRATDGAAAGDLVEGGVDEVEVCVDTAPPPPGGCFHSAGFDSGADGWTNGADTCTTGSFVAGTPDATTWQVGGGNPGGAFFTQPNPGGIGTDDVDGGTCEALSPVVDCAGEAAAEVSLDYFHGQRDAADDAADGFTIEVLNDGAVVATMVAIGDVTETPAWTSVSTVVTNPGAIQVRVRATDGTAGGDIVEGGIDNVRISPATAVACTVVDDFEGGAAGWSNAPASTCTTGAYVLGDPTEVVNGGVTTQVGGSNSGVSSIFTATNSAAGTDDVDGGNCILASPSWSVGASSTLSVAWWHGQRDTGGDPSGDFFRLEYSTDGGASWNTLVSNGDATSNAAWAIATAQIPAGSTVELRVQCSDGTASGDLIECGIDDVSICDN